MASSDRTVWDIDEITARARRQAEALRLPIMLSLQNLAPWLTESDSHLPPITLLRHRRCAKDKRLACVFDNLLAPNDPLGGPIRWYWAPELVDALLDRARTTITAHLCADHAAPAAEVDRQVPTTATAWATNLAHTALEWAKVHHQSGPRAAPSLHAVIAFNHHSARAVGGHADSPVHTTALAPWRAALLRCPPVPPSRDALADGLAADLAQRLAASVAHPPPPPIGPTALPMGAKRATLAPPTDPPSAPCPSPSLPPIPRR